MNQHFSDRSRYETGMKCLRKRYLNYHYDGRGVVPVGGSWDLLFGTAIHAFVEGSSMDRSVDLSAYRMLVELEDTNIQETAALYTGLCETFSKYNLPAMQDEYEFISAEQEMTIDVGSTKWMSRLDGVLKRKDDGLWFVLETKTSSMPDKLLQGASTNFQLLMECEAMRRHYSLEYEQVGGAMLLIFNKGKKQRYSAAEQSLDGYRRISPFTYGYRKEYKNGTVGYSPEYTKGWDRFPAWETLEWDKVLAGYEDLVRNQVQLAPAVSFDRNILESVLAQVSSVEKRIGYSGGFSIDEDWPQNWSNCHNDGGFNKPCPYLPLCTSPRMAKDPVATGEYEWRQYNHPQENNDGIQNS